MFILWYFSVDILYTNPSHPHTNKMKNLVCKYFDSDKACCIYKWLHSFVYVLVIYMCNIIKINSLVIYKNTPSQKVIRVRWLEGGINMKPMVYICSSIDLANLFCSILVIDSRSFYTTFWIKEWLLFQWVLVLKNWFPHPLIFLRFHLVPLIR